MIAAPLMQSAPGPETIIDGVRYLYFGGTSYLGLAAHPEVIEAGCGALRQFGVHTATTRSGFGTNPPVQEAERRAAEYFGMEEAFYFGSGYVSNHILASALAPEADAVFVDRSAHYCVVEAARGAGLPLILFEPRDPEALARATANAKRVLVMADAVGSATGALAPVNEYLRVLEGHERAILLLDDAHGFGVLGPNGRGLLDELGLWPRANRESDSDSVQIVVGGTLAKALGGFGGIIPGTPHFVSAARKGSHYYDGASAPGSAAAASTAKALEIVMREPALRVRLRENALELRRRLRGLGLTVPDGATAHFGIVIGDAENMRRVHEALKARGILLPYIQAYAGLPPEGVLRVAVFANHTPAQLDQLASELGKLL
jgi:7-keto-8-aminopelargonate synthetase-like enzyme